MRPRFCKITPGKNRGRREDRVRAAPAVSRANSDRKNAHEHTGSAETLRPSLRNGFNGLLRALPGDRAFLPPSLREGNPAKLSASVGAPGPHDFAVRSSHARQSQLSHPPHPAPTFVTMANAPLIEDRTAGDVDEIWVRRKGKYFFKRDWTGQISL